MQQRKDEARHDRRVELRREDSGAASLAGRELDPAEALAGKASIDAEAVRLRNAGLPGTLAQIRALILHGPDPPAQPLGPPRPAAPNRTRRPTTGDRRRPRPRRPQPDDDALVDPDAPVDPLDPDDDARP